MLAKPLRSNSQNISKNFMQSIKDLQVQFWTGNFKDIKIQSVEEAKEHSKDKSEQ